MGQSTHITMRVPEDQKAVLQTEADKLELSLSQYIKDSLERLEPLSQMTSDALKTFAKGLKLSHGHLINCCVISTLARLEVETQLFGEFILNPFIMDEVENWDDVFRYFKRKYSTALYANEAGAEAHERWIEKQRDDLIKRKKKIKEKYKK